MSKTNKEKNKEIRLRAAPNNGTWLKTFKKNYLNNIELYIMLMPMLLFFLVFLYKPMPSLVIAFKDYSPFKGIWESPWVGFEYFREFFASPFAFRVIRNTLVISLTSLVVCFPMPIVFALLLNELRAQRFKKIVQTISYIPHFISVVIVCGLVINFLAPTSGVVNVILQKFGIDSIYFLAKPQYFLFIYIIMEIWKTTGYASIIYISALTSIPSDLYEAAAVDGAGRWKQTIHVTLPCLMPTIVIMLLVRLGGILNVGYESIILLYNPGIYEASDVISTYVYRTGLSEGRYDYATAVGLINSVVAFVLVVIANKVSNKLTNTGLW